MTSDFQKPFAAPPIIFGGSLLVTFPIGFVVPWPILPLWVQVVAGALLVLAGVLLIRASMQEIAGSDTTYDPFSQSTALVTTGIYRFSRNPGYLGLATIQLGVAALIDSIWVAAAALLAAIVTTIFVIRLEERKLLNVFGQGYTEYCNQVRRWL